MTRAEFSKTFLLWKETQDKKLLDKLVLANMPLVLKLAGRIYKAGKTFAFRELEDAYQAGAIGLLRALNSFDITRGFAFSTYAAFWIRHEVNRCFEKSARMYVPPNGVMPYKVYHAVCAFFTKEGKKATAADLNLPKITDRKLQNWEYRPMVDSLTDKDTDGDESDNYLRRRQEMQEYYLSDENIEEEFNKRQVSKGLEEGFKILTENERSVLNWILEEGKSVTWISQKLKLPNSEVEKIWFEALSELKEYVT